MKMAIIMNEDILGYSIGEQTVCEECIDKSEEAEVTEEDILDIDWAEKEDALIFCDRCKKRIY